MPQLSVQRLPQRLPRDATRTIARFFWPGGPEQAEKLVDHVLELPAADVSRLLDACVKDFDERYEDLRGIFEGHYDRASARLGRGDDLSMQQRQLIGAYFTMEYAYASAALFNPSMVAIPARSELPPGSSRFLMSLRAVGEGHISSIVFRAGVIDADCGLTFDPVPARSRRLRVVEDRQFTKVIFRRKLAEAGGDTELAGLVLDRLGDQFSHSEMECVIRKACHGVQDAEAFAATTKTLRWLAESNYMVTAPQDAEISELVVFPLSGNEANGIEDMRLVRFIEEDGSARYYGSYTAFDGSAVMPQLMEIRDRTAEVHTLAGRHAVGKGMALFPRRLGGRYAMLGRFDGRSLYLMYSDSLTFWDDAVLVQEPQYPWQLVQIGNCGSPIETDAGWLLLTHGVGPMRRYSIGATLLDRDDPSKVLGQLRDPLLMPLADQKGGYVPNVVYSCGAMVHADCLVIPFGVSDVETAFATVCLSELLQHLVG